MTVLALAVAVAQPACVPLDLAANALAHGAAVVAAGARVVVFPEMSLTGYVLDAPSVDPADPRLDPLIEACTESDSVALAGAPVDDPRGGRSIAVLAVDWGGATVAYRKMWLGPAEVEAGFVPGPAPVAMTIDGWRLGLAICKDTGIVEHAAVTADLGIDAYVAGVVHHAHEAHVHGERARRVAADHGVWVATASFAGPTGGGYEETAGRSGVWAPDGSCQAETGPSPGEQLTTLLDRRLVR